MKLRLFTGAYNAGRGMLHMLHGLRDLKPIMDAAGIHLKVLLFDDGSMDATREVMEGFAAEFNWVQLQKSLENQGNTQTILSGYSWALADATPETYVACIDADGEHEPLEIAARLRRHLVGDSTHSVVGSINFPDHMVSPTDQAGMRMLGGLQAMAAGADAPFYIHSPGFQIHHAPTVAEIITSVVPRYVEFYQFRYGTMPPWGIHGVILHLLGAKGVKIESVYLGCYGKSPHRTPEKLRRQMSVGLHHLDVLSEFLQLPGAEN